MARNLLMVSDFTKEECMKVIKKGIEIKNNRDAYTPFFKKPKTLLMIFEKPSLRTRVSFESGMAQLGGHAIFYSIKDSPLGTKENLYDTANCASRYVDIIAARVYKRKDIWEIADFADVPVINLLDDNAHPCQILSDFATILEKKGRLDKLKLAYFGDAHNNVTYDLMRMCAIFGLKMDVACPKGDEYSPEESVLEEVEVLSEKSDARIHITQDAFAAALNSDIIYTDSWMSYGVPKDQERERKSVFLPYQVNEKIMGIAKPDSIFMNCLPAKRGYEQTAKVIDGPKSVVFDQAENRLHVQKAIILFLLGML